MITFTEKQIQNKNLLLEVVRNLPKIRTICYFMPTKLGKAVEIELADVIFLEQIRLVKNYYDEEIVKLVKRSSTSGKQSVFHLFNCIF